MSKQLESKLLEKMLLLAKEVSANKGAVVGVAKMNIYKTGVNTEQVGLAHEFGTKHLPQRSFIREPIKDGKDDILAVGIKQLEKEFVNDKPNIKKAMQYMAIEARNKIIEAFETQGNGKWQANKIATIKRKQGKASAQDNVLVDTGALRNSITWEFNE